MVHSYTRHIGSILTGRAVRRPLRPFTSPHTSHYTVHLCLRRGIPSKPNFNNHCISYHANEICGRSGPLHVLIANGWRDTRIADARNERNTTNNTPGYDEPIFAGALTETKVTNMAGGRISAERRPSILDHPLGRHQSPRGKPIILCRLTRIENAGHCTE